MADQRDLVLSPVQYAFVQDGSTSGNVRVLVGPLVDTLTQNDRLVIWTGRKFMEQPDTQQARQTFVTATENQYIILTDPMSDGHEEFPNPATSSTAKKLDVGKRIVIPGPTTFPLWPGQEAKVIDGHRLSYNEYLVVQVYEPEAAKRYQERAVTAPQTGEGDEPAVTPKASRDFVLGERIVIKGTDVSFYIPPTGIEVLREDRESGGAYVRKAAVVEQLEYVSLRDENGRKRIEKGPQVVFPEPTETFLTEKGERKFRAIELNAQSGLYIKVTTDYKHDGAELQAWRGDGFVTVKNGDMLEEGDELFLTGSDAPIYFPRTEHSVILYGDKRKHHAVAIPAGEGRYVLDRTKGEVRKVEGPAMFLPDPRTEVVVRRVLEGKTVGLWYPGNQEAMQVNMMLAGEKAANEGQYLATDVSIAAAASTGQPGALARSYGVSSGLASEKMRRGTEYTPPRTITLDTKYLGPPTISVWPGYAVMVMDPTGNRRVEVGPVDLLMEYHQTLMALTFSTGRPKGTGTPYRTVYLRTINNAVGDRLTVETRDLVPVTIELSLRVNFEEGDQPEDRNRWFDVEDYVALLTDNVRSRVRNLAKRHDVQEFYANTIDLIRDDLLGMAGEAGRPGRYFSENGMTLFDVEVLDVTIQHPGVRAMLDQATAASLEGAIKVSQEQEATRREATLQSLKRDRIGETEKTRVAEAEAVRAEIERGSMKSMQAIAAQLQQVSEEAKISEAERAQERAQADLTTELMSERNAVELARTAREVELFVQKAAAVDPKLVDAIRTYGQENIVREITTAIAPLSLAGVPAVDILRNQFQGTSLGHVFEALSQRPYEDALAGGSNHE